MKSSLVTACLILLSGSLFSQQLKYDVRGLYARSVKKEKLQSAQSMADISAGYPSAWITDYVSAEILATTDGKTQKASSANDKLSEEQKNILQSVEPGTDIVINVTYKYKNPVTDNADIQKMHFALTVVPETEAEYMGGRQQLLQYVKEMAISKIPESDSKQMQPAVVRFTVNETGEIINARVVKPSGNNQIDKLLLHTITNMPKWKPAQQANGVNVKQEFELSVGNNEGC
jgi:TonB family protein